MADTVKVAEVRGLATVTVIGPTTTQLYVAPSDIIALRTFGYIGWTRKHGFFTSTQSRAAVIAFLSDLRGLK